MNAKYASRLRAFVFFLFVAALVSGLSTPASSQQYQRTNLVSDIPGVAQRVDANLVNPWGIAFAPASPIWIANNGTGTSTLYQGNGQAVPLVVTVPAPAGVQTAAPTGMVFNGTTDFVVSGGGKSGPALFIFATEDGTISGWSPAVDVHNAILVVNNSAPAGVDSSSLGAVYKGLATGDKGSSHFLFAANFRDGAVEIYDSHFKFVKWFTDSSLPAGFAPFGIQNIGGWLYVTFAKQNEAKHDDVAGPGSGFVDVFDTDGHLVSRFVSGGALNSPWGLALAPEGFGKFSHDVLIGNFGDGHINAYEPGSGEWVGQLVDTLGQPMAIEGLWALKFASGGPSGKANHLLFTAGIGGEAHGLFGVIRHRDDDDDHGRDHDRDQE